MFRRDHQAYVEPLCAMWRAIAFRRGLTKGYLQEIAVFDDLKERIDRAFPAEQQDGSSYMTIVRDNWKSTEVRYTRTVSFALVAILLAELLRQGAVAEISLTGVKLENLGFLNLTLPILISYLILEAATYAASAAFLQRLYVALIRRFEPGLFQENLEVPLAPAESLLFEPIFNLFVGSRALHLLTRGYSYTRGVVVAALPLIFLTYYYSELYRSPHSILLHMSLLLSITLLIFAAVASVIAFRSAWPTQ